MKLLVLLLHHFIMSSSSTQQQQFPRFRNAQRNRTFYHPNVKLSDSSSRPDDSSEPHTFVVTADTQLGMASGNASWDEELRYSRQCVAALNALQPKPLFCCVCGDLVDMTASLFRGNPKYGAKEVWTEEECNRVQDQQNDDFKSIWKDVDPEIALVCLCGNHDVGNRPQAADIERFKNSFGDDYLAFWARNTYNIVVNSSLFNDPSGAEHLYKEQLQWLEDRLRHAVEHKAGNIFVFSHHPWFLYQDDEESDDLKGISPFGEDSVPDGYFHIPAKFRKKVMELFRDYQVTACFSGHFHQNLVSKSSFGMDMIVTSSLSVVLESTGIPKDFDEPKTRGYRIVRVQPDPAGGRGTFQHQFVSLPDPPILDQPNQTGE
jgi:3',5'-cyclic AMP phosphodiesterase CpdA